MIMDFASVINFGLATIVESTLVHVTQFVMDVMALKLMNVSFV